MFELVAGFTVALAYVGSVALVVRRAEASPAALAIILAVDGHLVLLAVVLVLGVPASFWALSISYWFVAVSFLMLFGAVYKSISLRMILNLYERPARSAPEDAVKSGYVEADSFESRLAVMVRSGFVEEVAGGYLLLPKGRRVAGVAAALQKAFAIERSG
ncbi:MAG: hypothetical protein Q8P46_07795 [Hyphomicrobiales bacterium]|nr:hypothetical protein [Hyphomicrobiales bacterium]